MAMAVTINRKLFPVATNCSACPYDCPFDCYAVPDFLFSPPPPPASDNHQTHLQPLLIVLIALFVGFFLAFTFYTIAVKCRSTGNRGSSPPQSAAGEAEYLTGNQIDHPIWFITTAGLQQSVINSITVCKYGKNEGLIDGTDCSVCLSEFEEGETLRLLPKCSHAFHIGCVDTWLRTHTTCPLCRAHIVNDFASSNSNLGSVDRSEGDLVVVEETQIEIGGDVSGGENRGDFGEEQSGEIVVVHKDGEVEGNNNEIVRRDDNDVDSSS